MILYFAADLLWASKIKGTAEALGLTARPVRTLEMLNARLAEYAPPSQDLVQALVVDMDAPETAMSLIARVRSLSESDPCRGIPVLAFGPHVNVDALHAARAAGASSIMTRGAFAARLPDTLRALAQSRQLTDRLED